MRSRAWTGKGPVRHSSDGFGRSALTLNWTTQQGIILVQTGPIAETRGQAPRAPGPLRSESQRDADDGGVAIDVGLVRDVVVGKRVAGEEGVPVFREEGHESDESDRQAGAELAAHLEVDAIARQRERPRRADRQIGV